MAEHIRSFSFYVDGRRVKFMTSVSLEGDSNSEQIAVDGDLVLTSGVPTSSATIESAICVEGHDSTQKIFDAWDRGEYIPCTFGVIDGRILSAEMTVKTLSYKSDPKVGSTTFSGSLIGKKIKKVG